MRDILFDDTEPLLAALYLSVRFSKHLRSFF
jgi:hypothetical protein